MVKVDDFVDAIMELIKENDRLDFDALEEDGEISENASERPCRNRPTRTIADTNTKIFESFISSCYNMNPPFSFIKRFWWEYRLHYFVSFRDFCDMMKTFSLDYVAKFVTLYKLLRERDDYREREPDSIEFEDFFSFDDLSAINEYVWNSFISKSVEGTLVQISALSPEVRSLLSFSDFMELLLLPLDFNDEEFISYCCPI